MVRDKAGPCAPLAAPGPAAHLRARPTIRRVPTAAFAVPTLQVGGNRVTALRWARCLRRLGWRTFVEVGWSGRPADLLVALHARHAAAAIERWRERTPPSPLFVAATGTDLYLDLAQGGERGRIARAGLEAADRILVLQGEALAALPDDLRERARVVHQSFPGLADRGPEAPADRAADGSPAPDRFEVCVLANLRAVKDPLLAARAVRRLPPESRARVTLLGAELDSELAREARDLEGPRFRWLGPRARRAALCTLARSRLCVQTSRAEGGANVLTEALALDVPLLATRIPGAVGLLGDDHPGLFPVGDEQALAELIGRAEREPEFRAALAEHGRRRAWITAPELELATWRGLLTEVGLPVPAPRAIDQSP